MTKTSKSIKIPLNYILIWLSIIIIFSLLIYLLISQTKSNKSSDVPLGTIIALATEASPDGYLYCDGSPVPQRKYPKLVQIIGDNLPDLRHKFLRGRQSEKVLTRVDEDTTAVNGLKIADHTHDYKSYKDGGTGQPGSGGFVASQAGGYSTDRGLNNVYTSDDGSTSPV